MKPHWNIWSIENRWLRAAVTWAIVIPTVVYAVLVLIVATIFFAVSGACREVGSQFSQVDDDIGWLGKNAWRAMTLRDAE